ncbi:hypothetical protein [Mangrovicoccus sp. HB161399]|uniref:hypothetical protein n=1 Tax=Mangrovicoccus sp. HB161399 TaxID=2720392 RepID=UPI001552E9AB|nr:hypothetical protein [Mangrovicoccus sp. HB161399]
MAIRIRCAAAAALLVFAGAAQAQDYMDLARELYREGYENQAKIRVRGETIHVEVTGSAGKTERVYSRDGSRIIEEETTRPDGTRVEREYDRDGKVVEERVRVASGGAAGRSREGFDDDSDDDRDDDRGRDDDGDDDSSDDGRDRDRSHDSGHDDGSSDDGDDSSDDGDDDRDRDRERERDRDD